jgi:hypothetical protein
LGEPWAASGKVQQCRNVWLLQNPLTCLPCQLEAARNHHFRLDRSIYIGVDSRDAVAAFNAGCPSILVDPSATSIPAVALLRLLNLRHCLGRYRGSNNVLRIGRRAVISVTSVGFVLPKLKRKRK